VFFELRLLLGFLLGRIESDLLLLLLLSGCSNGDLLLLLLLLCLCESRRRPR